MSRKENKEKKTSIGGQAVMEGVMMRGKTSMATAVRDPYGEIQVESERLHPSSFQKKSAKIPFWRGGVNLVYSLIDGNKVLFRSADVAMLDEEEEKAAKEETKAEQWLKDKHKVKIKSVLNFLEIAIAMIFAVGLFVVAPQLVSEWILPFDKTSKGLDGLWFNLCEGGMRLIVFIAYILIISLIPDLRRVYMNHGAEHKTITCYEKGWDLTVENVRKCSRVHDRCGTTFLFLTVVISVLVFSIVNVAIVRWFYIGNKMVDSFIRIGFKILFLPLIAGTSYEVLRLLAKTKSKLLFPLKAPGLLLQHLTTREPEDSMIECAITAFKTVLAMDEDASIPERSFVTPGGMNQLLKNTKMRFENMNIDAEEAEWLFALTLDVPKSAVNQEDKYVNYEQAKEIIRMADERLAGKPLWYIVGDTDFCGYNIKVDERVLIPRPETEEMAMMVVNTAEDGNKVLDLCTGSGAIAVTIAKESEKQGKTLKVVASDISEDALTLAKENAKANGAEIEFICSDLFENVTGKFDIIVSNPPYIPTKEIDTLQREVKDHEPRLALDGGEDGLDYYRKIAQTCRKHLNKGGTLIMEVGAGEAAEIVKLFTGDVYTIVAQDFNGIDRYVKVIM